MRMMKYPRAVVVGLILIGQKKPQIHCTCFPLIFHRPFQIQLILTLHACSLSVDRELAQILCNLTHDLAS